MPVCQSVCLSVCLCVCMCLCICLYVCSDDPGGDYPNTRLVLQELSLTDVTLDDCRNVQHVCWQVSQRAAHLAATGQYRYLSVCVKVAMLVIALLT